MELPAISIGIGSVLLALAVTWAWRVLNWVWLKPKRLERLLREQGFKGNPYRFLFGDLKDTVKMLKESRLRPIGLSDDPVPRIFPYVSHSVNTFGKDSFIWLGPTPRLNIMNPDYLKEIFSKIHDFQKPPSNPLVRLLATGLASYEGEKWVTHRKIINPAFHSEKLKLMIPACYSSCNEVVTRWDKLISTEGSVELDAWPELQNLTRDVISRIAFGSSYEEGKRIFELQEEQVDLAIKFLQTVYIPGWRFVPTKMNRRMKLVTNEVHSLLREIINRREKAIRAGEVAPGDLLGLLLESNMEEIQENNGNMGMSTEDVIEECKLFYFAGQETTSVLLVWTMILLSIHPKWQTQAREEVLQVFGRDGKPDLVGLNHLKIVTMILYEVLRLYPPVIVLGRFIHKEMKLGELTIPAGVQLALPIVLIHHDKELWGEDAKEFRPERFSEGISKATKNQISYFPFGWGPRICIGMNFALIEAKMAMAMILQRFLFELSPSYAHAPETVITLHPQHGAQVILRKA
uniref:Cytochrome P450 monooxygenase n=1 Tax=Lagerstroemia speciosa TaxID=122810 RepID=A0A451F5H4_LAGSP|nr:cytochrome P450 monooxygenase [Lagerstroemia speciosa]